MANIREVRFVLSYNGELRRVLKIIERDNHDLIISTSKAEFRRGYAQNSSDAKLAQHKVSVHSSQRSSTGINVIKDYTEYSDGLADDFRTFTFAFKKNNTFLPLYARRSQDLSIEKYVTSDTGSEIVNMGGYDPKTCTLYFSPIVHNNDTDFTGRFENDYNYKTIKFNNFAVTLVWTYKGFPSDATAYSFGLLSGPEEWGGDLASDGQSEEETMKMFFVFCETLWDEVRYLNSIARNSTVDFPEGFKANC